MQTKQQSIIRHKLLELRQQTAHELERIVADGLPSETKVPAVFGDRGEVAGAVHELSKRTALGQGRIDILTAIERAIEKVDNGSYGICDSCGHPIESERLEILPYASQCITCKSSKQRINRGGAS